MTSADSTPNPTYVGLDKVSSTCTTGFPPNVLTGVLLRSLQEHFSSTEGIQYNGTNEFANAEATKPLTELETYIWNENKEVTKIQIQPVWAYNPVDIQRRPGLYVKRNTLQTQRLGINDGLSTGSIKKDGKVESVPGAKKSVMVLGSHTIFCVGNTGAAAELLGAEVMNHFLGFSPIIRQEFRFHRFTVVQMAEVALLDEFDEHFVVPVVIGWAFAYTWRINQIAPWLKTISINTDPT